MVMMRCLNNDYYPFGMLVPNRNFQSPEYRYGFQGQEKDDEIKGIGNSLNYKYRMHDPRVGRFFAVDPLTAKYPHYTPYSFSGNKVIAFGELEGLEETIQTKQFTKLFKPILVVWKNDKYLSSLYKEISKDSRKDTHVIYFTTFKGKIEHRAFVVELTNKLKRYNYLLKLNQYEKSVNDEKKETKSFFEGFDINFEQALKKFNSGKKIFMLSINSKSFESDDIPIVDKTFTIVHEINAKDHLKDELNGVDAENEYDGHIDYYDLKNHPSGLSKKEIEKGYSPLNKNIYPKSKAGKDYRKVQEAFESIYDEIYIKNGRP